MVTTKFVVAWKRLSLGRNLQWLFLDTWCYIILQTVINSIWIRNGSLEQHQICGAPKRLSTFLFKIVAQQQSHWSIKGTTLCFFWTGPPSPQAQAVYGILQPASLTSSDWVPTMGDPWCAWLWWHCAGSCLSRVSASCSRVMKMRKNTSTDVLI